MLIWSTIREVAKRKDVLITAGILLAVIAGGVGVAWLLKGRTYTLHIEKHHIQSALNKKLPYDTDCV